MYDMFYRSPIKMYSRIEEIDSNRNNFYKDLYKKVNNSPLTYSA